MNKKLLLVSLAICTQSFADCKITKQTYEVVGKHMVCTYTMYWRESSNWSGKNTSSLYRAQSYNIQISPECASFPKPLKGKRVKTEFIRKIVGSDCPFEGNVK